MFTGLVALILTASQAWESLPLESGGRIARVSPTVYAVFSRGGIRLVQERTHGQLDRLATFSDVHSPSSLGFWQFDPIQRNLNWVPFIGKGSAPINVPGHEKVGKIIGRPMRLGMIERGGHYYQWNGKSLQFVGLEEDEVSSSLYAMLPDGSVLGSVVRERYLEKSIERQRFAVRWRSLVREDVHPPGKPKDALLVLAVSPNQQYALFAGESGRWFVDYQKGRWVLMAGVRGASLEVNDEGLVYGLSWTPRYGQTPSWFYGEAGKPWQTKAPWGSSQVPGTGQDLFQLEPLSPGMGFIAHTANGSTYWVRPRIR